MSYQCITVEEAQELINTRHAHVIDIRDPASYEAGHIEQAEHVSDQNVKDFVLNTDKTRPLIVCCYHGNMSQGAADYFSQNGFAETYSLNGGFDAWQVFAK